MANKEDRIPNKGRPPGSVNLLTLKKNSFKREMMHLAGNLKLSTRIQSDLSRLDAMQNEAGTLGEELDVLKLKMASYLNLLPYFMPKLASVTVTEAAPKPKMSDEEANAELDRMINDKQIIEVTGKVLPTTRDE